jgi:hypothetical protein
MMEVIVEAQHEHEGLEDMHDWAVKYWITGMFCRTMSSCDCKVDMVVFANSAFHV